MNPIFKTYHPEGFGTVNAYIFSNQPQILINFLKNAFYAEEINRSINPDNGNISNCILKIGDSCFMISQPRDKSFNMYSAFYLFVNDVDTLHNRAVANGAQVEFEPADMPYNDRQSGVIDPSGNYWWISKRLIEKGYHE